MSGSVKTETFVAATSTVRRPYLITFKERVVNIVCDKQRKQKQSAEQIGNVPQLLEETVEAVTLVPREQVQQLTAVQIGDVPQLREATVEVVNTTLQQHISVRSEAIKVSVLAVSSGEAGSARPGEKDTTNASVKAVARPAGGARPLGIAKHSTTTESDVGVSSGESWPYWPGVERTPGPL